MTHLSTLSDLQLRWEILQGKQWVPVEPEEDTSQNFSVGINSSPPGGEITFTLAEQVEPGEVNGVPAILGAGPHSQRKLWPTCTL